MAQVLPKMKVGITGHRKLGDDPRVFWHARASCVLILDRLRELARLQGTELVAYSALAIGADQLFAEAALSLGLPLVGVIPFEDYPRDFEGDDRKQFEMLLGFCREVHWLRRKRRSNEAYLALGKWMVDNTDHLVAVWNGLAAAGKGGTGDIVEYACKKGRSVIRIDPAGSGETV
jgi:hypothetical protein